MNVFVVYAGGGDPPRQVVPSYENVYGDAWSLIPNLVYHEANLDGIFNTLRQKKTIVDLVVFEPSAEDIHYNKSAVRICAWCKKARIPVVSWDTDVLNFWFMNEHRVTESIIKLFDVVNRLLIRHPRNISIAEAITATPVVLWYDVSSSVTQFSDMKNDAIRKNILVPASFGAPADPLREYALDAAVLSKLHSKFPDYHYGSAGTAGCPSFFEKRLGIDHLFTQTKRLPREEVMRRLQSAKLFINIDSRSVGGHWTLDAAAFGVPAITTRATSSGYSLGNCVSYPCSLEEAVDVATTLLNNQKAWEEASMRAQKLCKRWSAAAVGSHLNQMLAEIAEE